MAAPNVVNVTTITGKTAVASLTTAVANVITNSAASSQLYKINYISVANYSGSTISTAVMFNRSSTIYYLAGTVSIPAYSTLVVSAKDTAIYLEEGDVLQANVSANSAASITASYEIIA